MKKIWYTLGLALIVIIGLLLLLLGTTLDGFWKSAVDNISATLMISGCLGVIDQYLLKNELINYIISKVGLKKSIDLTGLTDIQYGYNGINYTNIFDKTEKKIDIVHAYAQTWTRTYTDSLVIALRDTNVSIRVVLMDPNCSELMQAYSSQFNLPSTQTLVDKINEVTRRWKEIYERSRITNPERLKIYFHNNIQTVALYRFDNTLICNLLHITKKPQIYNFPSLICTRTGLQNDLFTVYLSEIEQLIKDSREVPINTL